MKLMFQLPLSSLITLLALAGGVSSRSESVGRLRRLKGPKKGASFPKYEFKVIADIEVVQNVLSMSMPIPAPTRRPTSKPSSKPTPNSSAPSSSPSSTSSAPTSDPTPKPSVLPSSPPSTSSAPTIPTSSCCYGHAETGCDTQECEQIVCGLDSFCCSVGWDVLCTNEALSLCPICGGSNFPTSSPSFSAAPSRSSTPSNAPSFSLAPSSSLAPSVAPSASPAPTAKLDSNCCSHHRELGCDKSYCTDTICAFDRFCCHFGWDDICVEEAKQLCPVCSGGGGSSVVEVTSLWQQWYIRQSRASRGV